MIRRGDGFGSCVVGLMGFLLVILFNYFFIGFVLVQTINQTFTSFITCLVMVSNEILLSSFILSAFMRFVWNVVCSVLLVVGRGIGRGGNLHLYRNMFLFVG